MTVHIESFEEIGLDVGDDGTVYNDAESQEAMQLIESLGLEGQKSLQQRRHEAPGETRNPYRVITMEERRVYKIHLPETSGLANYDGGPIPLRVLQIAAHATEMGMECEVWHTTPGHPDPLLVGLLNERPGRANTFILARWGSILVPFAELREQAIQKAKELLAAKVASARSVIDGFNVDAAVTLHFQGKNEHAPWIHLTIEG